MMNKKKLQLYTWEDTKVARKVIQSLKQNNVSVTTTDTVLGFLANTTHDGFIKLNVLKGERQNKPYLILIDSLKKLSHFVQIENITPTIHHFLTLCWPGPVSIIFQAKKNLPIYLQSPHQTIAIRCPKHPKLQKILLEFSGLFSTSANKSGAPIPQTPDAIHQSILTEIKYVILENQKEATSHALPLSSTIIDISHVMKEGPQASIQVIREGMYPIKDLERIYGNHFER